jgi:hypothetical protein
MTQLITGWPRSPASTRAASKRGHSAPPGYANGRNNLAVINGEPTAAQLSAAQKATRPANPNRCQGSPQGAVARPLGSLLPESS